MASEIRVDSLKTTSGLGTVTFNNSGVVLSGIVTAKSASFTSSVNAPIVSSDFIGCNSLEINKISSLAGLGGTITFNGDGIVLSGIATVTSIDSNEAKVRGNLQVFNSTTGTRTTLQTSTAAGDNIIILPPNNGNGYQILRSDGTPGTLEFTDKIVSGTVNAGGTNPFPSTNGPTYVDFLNIPTWVKRITVMFNGVSTSGTSMSNLLVQLGTSSGAENSGYTATAYGQTNVVLTTNAGFILNCTTVVATDSRSGMLTISTIGSNTWIASGTVSPANGQLATCSGIKTLSDILDRIRITTASYVLNPATANKFDAGSINILYE